MAMMISAPYAQVVFTVTTMALIGFPQSSASTATPSKADMARMKAETAAAKANGFRRPQKDKIPMVPSKTCSNDVLRQILLHQCGNPNPIKPKGADVSKNDASKLDLLPLGLKSVRRLVKPYSRGPIDLARIFDFEKTSGVRSIADAEVILCGSIHEPLDPWTQGCEQVVSKLQSKAIAGLELPESMTKSDVRRQPLLGDFKPDVVFFVEGIGQDQYEQFLQGSPTGPYVYSGMEGDLDALQNLVKEQSSFDSLINGQTEITEDLIEQKLDFHRRAKKRDDHVVELINRALGEGRKVVLSVGSAHIRPEFIARLNCKNLITMTPKNYPKTTLRQKAIFEISTVKINRLVESRDWDAVLKCSDELDREIGPNFVTDSSRSYVYHARGEYKLAVSYMEKALAFNPYNKNAQQGAAALTAYFLKVLLHGYSSSVTKETDKQQILDYVSKIRKIINFADYIPDLKQINAALRVVLGDPKFKL